MKLLILSLYFEIGKLVKNYSISILVDKIEKCKDCSAKHQSINAIERIIL